MELAVKACQRPIDDVIVNCRKSFAVNDEWSYDLSFGVKVDCPGQLNLSKAGALDRLFHSIFMRHKIATIGTTQAIVNSNDATSARVFLGRQNSAQTIAGLFAAGFSEVRISKSYLIATLTSVKQIPFNHEDIAKIKSGLVSLGRSVPAGWQPGSKHHEDNERRFDNIVVMATVFMLFSGLGLAMFSLEHEGNVMRMRDTAPIGVVALVLYLAMVILARKLAGFSATMKNGMFVMVLMTSAFFFIPGSTLWVHAINQYFDWSNPKIAQVLVIEKVPNRDDSRMFDITAKAFPGARQPTLTLTVNSDVGSEIIPKKSKVRLTYKKGALGFPWLLAYKIETLAESP